MAPHTPSQVCWSNFVVNDLCVHTLIGRGRPPTRPEHTTLTPSMPVGDADKLQQSCQAGNFLVPGHGSQSVGITEQSAEMLPTWPTLDVLLRACW